MVLPVMHTKIRNNGYGTVVSPIGSSPIVNNTAVSSLADVCVCVCVYVCVPV
jgi:hypothetical protein